MATAVNRTSTGCAGRWPTNVIDTSTALAPIVQRYGEVDADDEPERLHAQGLSETRSGPLGLLRDLQDVYLLATMVDVTWSMTRQVAQGLRDGELLRIVGDCEKETAVQLNWLTTRMSQAAPQALIVAR